MKRLITITVIALGTLVPFATSAHATGTNCPPFTGHVVACGGPIHLVVSK